MADISTLVRDIEALFSDEPHECKEENLKILSEGIASVVSRRLSERPRTGPGTLRMSNLDKPDRQLWYEVKYGSQEELPPSAKIKFLFGDILEELLLFLAVEAGHEVKDRQKEISIDGIRGHIDAVIDNIVVDVKSASSQAFKGFSDKLIPDTLFSYAYQLHGYKSALVFDKAALLVIDKQLGHINLHITERDLDVKERITRIREALSRDTPPKRCYEDEADGKSGNRKLSVGCSYCSHKQRCWPGLRTFAYSTGPRYLTVVVREPDVFEVKSEV